MIKLFGYIKSAQPHPPKERQDRYRSDASNDLKTRNYDESSAVRHQCLQTSTPNSAHTFVCLIVKERDGPAVDVARILDPKRNESTRFQRHRVRPFSFCTAVPLSPRGPIIMRPVDGLWQEKQKSGSEMALRTQAGSRRWRRSSFSTAQPAPARRSSRPGPRRVSASSRCPNTASLSPE